MIQRCFALSYYLYCLRLRYLVSFLFYSTIYFQTNSKSRLQIQCADGFFRSRHAAGLFYGTMSRIGRRVKRNGTASGRQYRGRADGLAVSTV
ncbi:Uncharacterised protein [Neisseria animalis]|nr:Uncharacterised protein [Neisseria animalis]